MKANFNQASAGIDRVIDKVSHRIGQFSICRNQGLYDIMPSFNSCWFCTRLKAEHEKLLAWQEQMLQKCELPYRVIHTAAGDLGSSAARKYDIEAWVPSQETYRELTSTSNCTTFQARRLNMRYRKEDGKTTTLATLNGTLATTRWLVAILENHQQPDGSVRIPAALRPYLGGTEFIKPKAKA